ARYSRFPPHRLCRRRRGRRPQAALLGVDRGGRGADAHGARPRLSRDLAVQAARPADPRDRHLSKLAQGAGAGRHRRLDAGQPAQRHAHRDRAGRPGQDVAPEPRGQRQGDVPATARGGRPPVPLRGRLVPHGRQRARGIHPHERDLGRRPAGRAGL
ncbi:MAG: hypothetical protein AVDCRST_MAG91-1132, partial [uncultured Sphingomonadaceae bacterium]